MDRDIEGCPLQYQKIPKHKAGDCRTCPQAEGCIFLIIMKKLSDIERKLGLLAEQVITQSLSFFLGVSTTFFLVPIDNLRVYGYSIILFDYLVYSVNDD